jgi:hypothetical protein
MADPKLIPSRLAPRSQRKAAPKPHQLPHRKNIFVFTSHTSNRVILKLPKERIAALLQREDITLLAMGKRTMKEWIVIERSKPADYKKDLALFNEAKAFVEAGTKK